jgi:hypothetical protein
MGKDNITLRLHHLVNLNKGYLDDFSKHEEGLIMTKCDNRRVHTDTAAREIVQLYRTIASDPNQEIVINKGIDDICRRCNNYDGKACTMYAQRDLLFEDERSHRHFPDIPLGVPISVSRLLEANIEPTHLMHQYLLQK